MAQSGSKPLVVTGTAFATGEQHAVVPVVVVGYRVDGSLPKRPIQEVDAPRMAKNPFGHRDCICPLNLGLFSSSVSLNRVLVLLG